MMQDTSYETALAIIGMSGRFPGANTVQQFWRNVAGGVKSIRFFRQEELEATGVDPALLKHPNYVKAGAVLEGIEQFDAAFFGFTPREAATMDPQHRLFLECAWEALENAAYDPQSYRGLIGVFGGAAFCTYYVNNLFSNPTFVDVVGPLQVGGENEDGSAGPSYQVDNDHVSLSVSTGNQNDSLASTVSYRLNLKGPSFTVQTFCSTSLVATHLACQSLLNYECDLALAGGSAISVPHLSGYIYKEGGIVSPDGQCRTFDAHAQGSVLGNGVGVVALKRLAEALQDGDHIYAIIRGSAVNNDGSLRVSYTAPGLEGQAAVIAEALGHAGVAAESISYIEAHGTATPLGDAVELAAMQKAFGLHIHKKQFCAIGSVKPNVGHLDRASGVTGLIKTALALYHQQLPPSLNFERAHEEVDLDNSPFYVNTRLQEWPANGTPRRAGVSSFGLGGTNAHVVLQEAPEREASPAGRGWHLLLLSARTQSALAQASANLAAHLQAHPELNLADVAYTLQVGRSAFNQRQVVVCREREEAISVLQSAAATQVWRSHQTQRERPVAFLFPGVGESYVGLTQQVYAQEPTFRETVDRCCRFLHLQFGLDLRAALYPDEAQADGHPSQANGSTGSAGSPEVDLRIVLGRNGHRASSAAEQLKQTAMAQPAAFVLEYALAQLLFTWGIRPQAMLGYSLGEYVAACLAGVFSLEDALTLVAHRAQLIAQLPQGTMLAVGLSEQAIQPYLTADVCLAASTGPASCVLAGPVEAIAQVETQLGAQEIAARRVQTTHAFHSSMLEPLREPVSSLVGGITLHAPQIPYISNVTGTWITAEQATDPAYWAEHMCQTVRFAQGVEHLLADREAVLVEVGPGQSLSALVKQHPACDQQRLSLVVPTLPSVYERQSEQVCLLTALGKLWLAGVAPDWQGFSAQQRRQRVPLPSYPFERQRYWIEPPRLQTVKELTPRAHKGKNPDMADWFYLPAWEQTPPLMHSSREAREQHSPYLVFLDSFGLGEQVAERLTQEGHSCICVQQGDQFAQLDERRFIIRPHQHTDYLALCKALHEMRQMPRTILHYWSLTQKEEEQAGREYFKEMQERGFYSLLFLTQALGAQIYAEPVQMVVVSNYLQAVTGCEALHPEKATMLGACKVIPQENLNITCRSIDIAIPGSGRLAGRQLVDRLIAECTNSITERIVAYRGATRWLQTYQPARLEAPGTGTTTLRQQGVYLITGGLGGVGLVLAEHLAQTVQARLVLLGRSGLPAWQSWSQWLA